MNDTVRIGDIDTVLHGVQWFLGKIVKSPKVFQQAYEHLLGMNTPPDVDSMLHYLFDMPALCKRLYKTFFPP